MNQPIIDAAKVPVFRIGDSVKFTSRKTGVTFRGVIDRLNPKTIGVKTTCGRGFRVPPAMLSFTSKPVDMPAAPDAPKLKVGDEVEWTSGKGGKTVRFGRVIRVNPKTCTVDEGVLVSSGRVIVPRYPMQWRVSHFLLSKVDA